MFETLLDALQWSLEPVPEWNIKLGPGKFSSNLYQRLSNVLKTNENKTILSILSGSQIS